MNAQSAARRNAGIQRLQIGKTLDPGYKHAGMTRNRDSSGSAPFNDHFNIAASISWKISAPDR